MVTTVGDRCGIAAYTRALVAGLETMPGIEVEVVPITEGRQPTAHYVAQASRLNAPDVHVVHIQHEHSFWGGILPRSSAYWEFRYLVKKPLVLTAHTTYSLAEMFGMRTERRPLKRIAKHLLLLNRSYRDSVEIAPFTTAFTITHTEEGRDALLARGANPSYVRVVPVGIPDTVPAPTEGRAFREKFRLGEQRLITLFGYLVPSKGYELTLEILPRLDRNIRFVIAGGPRTADSDSYAAGLRREIDARGLKDRVTITGVLSEEEIAEAMAASELVLAPHTMATGSYSVTIPIGYGRPVLASDLACFREINARFACLELFRAGDAEDYGRKMDALLADEPRRRQLAGAAREYAARTSWPKVAELTRDVYRAAISVYGSVAAGRRGG
jgi:glycosyltransferase involved in cell wall biosynthesis